MHIDDDDEIKIIDVLDEVDDDELLVDEDELRDNDIVDENDVEVLNGGEVDELDELDVMLPLLYDECDEIEYRAILVELLLGMLDEVVGESDNIDAIYQQVVDEHPLAVL